MSMTSLYDKIVTETWKRNKMEIQ